MATDPRLGQLLDMSVNRTAYQNPLFQAVTQMAYSGLPTYARAGTQLSGTLSNQAPAPTAQSGGGMSPLTSGILGGLGGAALNALGPGGNALGALIDGIKKLFSHQQGIQGNKPYGGGALTGPGNDRTFTGWDTGPTNPASPNFRPTGPGLTPNVSTDESFSWPPDVFNDPFFLNSQWNGSPTDPSVGSGTGPGMQDFYNWLRENSDNSAQGGGGNITGTDWWDE